MILSAQTIRRLCAMGQLVAPFHERTVQNGKSFGLSACGYDVRVDLKNHAEEYAIMPGEFLLACTYEHFSMPTDVVGRVHDKSSWARKGLAVQNTVIEPGWKGYLTLELTNHGSEVLVIRAGDPIAQILFERLDEPTHQAYTGKYQNQPARPVEAIEER